MRMMHNLVKFGDGTVPKDFKTLQKNTLSVSKGGLSSTE